ncbi:MAG: plsC 2 [Phycisphaerales bacterium]|jgi:1-acyl-sn-glycerol-3-phosphate acyltransferase|nr:plsC 2 [Phycisphaerales bacterium]MDB5300996.1 plsC 2 [Phycisphaerales bacterium]MDB5304610.1 plsC 2 [Phycisphaerales bacterium]
MSVLKQPKRIDRTRRTPVWIFVQQICRMVMTIFFDLKVYGAYHVPKTGGALLVSNHQSYIDPILLALGLDRTLSYLAKSQLFKNPVFSWLIRSLNAFPVEQGAGDIGAVKESIARLQEGHMLNVFPEGSRTEDGEMLPLEKGVALLIRRAKVPVVPAVITGSYEAWPKSKKWIRPYPIRVVFGPPMDLANLDREQILARIDETLRRMYDEARAGKFPRGPRRPKGR